VVIFGLSFGFILLAVLGMSVGVLAGRPAIRGSCGGLNGSIDGLPGCDVCAQPCPARKRAARRVPDRYSEEGQRP
jgi:hypothetical protein